MDSSKEALIIYIDKVKVQNETSLPFEVFPYRACDMRRKGYDRTLIDHIAVVFFDELEPFITGCVSLDNQVKHLWCISSVSSLRSLNFYDLRKQIRRYEWCHQEVMLIFASICYETIRSTESQVDVRKLAADLSAIHIKRLISENIYCQTLRIFARR
uniref:Uncharacterized protein n=1 Tax=Parascaris equorum TaxID=6256 RepID=A0A914RNC1_PAREQ